MGEGCLLSFHKETGGLDTYPSEITVRDNESPQKDESSISPSALLDP